MPDALDPSALLSSIPNLISTASTLKSPQDALVVLIHSSMNTLLFRLVGIDDSATVNSYPNNTLPEGWNAYGPGHYTLRYKHEQSSLEFVVKVSKLATRTMVNAIAVESDKAASLDIQTADFTSPSFFPHTLSEAGAQPLVHGFISSNRVSDFIQSYKLKIVQKLVPGLRKEGYTESTEDASSSQTRREQPRPQAPRVPTPPYPGHDPFASHPRNAPFGNPLSIGRRDLEPLLAHPNPFGPPPLFGGSGGDGMFVGPNHPIFSDRFTPGRGGGIGGHGHHDGPWGGDGFLPPMGAPPGARFDPVGPFGSPFGRGPDRGDPFGGPRGQGGPVGPDNDEFMPPGAVRRLFCLKMLSIYNESFALLEG
ncbi:hypothetical protein K439DRAFT_1504293 [Ramaria rubella]|nr:hypothetical protein K439DRAFT_1504293 [Ramaria rubella]